MGEEQKINNNNLNYIGKEKHVSRRHTLFFQRCDSALVERGTWRRKAAGCFPRRLFHGVLLAARLSLYCFAQKGGSGVLGTIFPSPFSSMHVWVCYCAGYCFLPDLSAEKADGVNEDSRCSQGPEQHIQPRLPWSC